MSESCHTIFHENFHIEAFQLLAWCVGTAGFDINEDGSKGMKVWLHICGDSHVVTLP